ncbi:MAG: YdeI/OmpD-associated family protein [Myxococcales bacterium]|nr:YdeI/OmpD-associated family protein [Myxococcales bacterium]
MPDPVESRIRSFEDPKAFHTWLAQHHDVEPELWLKIFKKHTKKKTIVWEEAVIEALCWGWIDGIKKSLDGEAYLQRFTPRRQKSLWSKRNREHVERLLQEGRMQEPGMLHVRAAQADGRWDAAYSASSEMVFPEDFLEALDKLPQAKAFFETLNKQNRYAIGYQLQTAKRPETRKKRMDKFLLMLENQEKLH